MQTALTTTSSPSDKVPIVLACDANYAMPLATALLSVVEANSRHWPLTFHILTDGFDEATEVKVANSLPAGSADVRWVPVDVSMYDELGVMPHFTRMTYARLQIPDIFPKSESRVLYLDTDILVLADLEHLWSADLEGAPIGAVPDYYIDADLKAGGTRQPAGVPRVNTYFNAGVMLMDLVSCRQLRLFEMALEHALLHPDLPYADQDSLNVVCDGLWQELDGKWNFQAHHIHRIASMPVDRRPAIVHFIAAGKPWKSSSTSINAALYDDFRSRTLFRLSRIQRVQFALSTQLYRARNVFKRIKDAVAKN